MPEDPEVPDDEPEDNAVIKQLRQRAERADEAESRASRLERENVVLKAGLNLSDKQFKALAAAHEGDWDADAVKATASELGFGKQPESAPEPLVSPEEAQAMKLTQDATTGERQPPAPDVDAVINADYASLEEYDAALRNLGILTYGGDPNA